VLESAIELFSRASRNLTRIIACRPDFCKGDARRAEPGAPIRVLLPFLVDFRFSVSGFGGSGGITPVTDEPDDADVLFNSMRASPPAPAGVELGPPALSLVDRRHVMRLCRVAFISCHGYLDPSSGAARATRELLELLAARGADCRALTTGVLDFRAEHALERGLGAARVPVRRGRAILCCGGSVPAFDLVLGGVRVTLLATAFRCVVSPACQAEPKGE
jgi:hypothetical protein